MISIWKKDNENWILIEELEDDLALAGRLFELRQGLDEYRAEKREGTTSSILEN